jgi:hypothetical protein
LFGQIADDFSDGDGDIEKWAGVCRDQAERNLAKWGPQDWETLGLAIAEETGELAQAILKCLHEGGPRERIQEEAVDLGALCLQLLQGFHVSNCPPVAKSSPPKTPTPNP